MKLHQLRLDYAVEQDRLLLRIATDDGKEVPLWLTRRGVKLLWPVLVGMAQSSPRIALQSNPEARAALLGMEHERALRGADFSSPYEEGTRERPFGPEPLLVAHIGSARDEEGNHVLALSTIRDQRVNVTFDDALLHSFCGLLQKVVGESDWDVALALPRSPVEDAVPAARTVN